MSDKTLSEQCVLCGEHFMESSLECFDYEVYCPNCGQLTELYWAYVREEITRRCAEDLVMTNESNAGGE